VATASFSLRARAPRRGWSRLRGRRQFGGSPIIAAPPGRGTVSIARFAVFVTAMAWVGYLVEQFVRLSNTSLSARTLAETGLYLFLVTLLTASALAYLVARLGYFERVRLHRRVPRSTIDDYFDQARPSLTVLVPSYREDERVIRQTLLSAALQEYPNIRVVLLVDDPPNPQSIEQRAGLERARALPALIAAELDGPRKRFEQALEAFEHEQAREPFASAETLEMLAEQYLKAADWFVAAKARLARVDHTDEFLAIEIFERMTMDLRATAHAIRTAAGSAEDRVSRRRVHQLYARLARIFQAELMSFERKQFASLSHEPNKAMNLNSYVGLMGGRYCEVPSPGGPVLVPAGRRRADLVIPDSDYVLTLDADSMLLPEYCLRLVYFLEQPENADVAVAQTPYSSFRGPSAEIERIAGATTDIQYIVHQGLTRYRATFWVGANAVIRKRALNELLEEEDESGFVIRRYIKDRTVIEDTESSIDLRGKGWRLYNYPERLSYSATPPDFGSLVVQRRRWSNGGLVILPGLVRLLWKRGEGVRRPPLPELYLRTNYLASISWASLGLLILLFYPFDGALLSRFAILTAFPYFAMMASDLRHCGYRWTDVFRIYGFNLLLLPVNLAGTGQSIVQAIGGQKIAFARTPKVRNRTVAPLVFLLVPVVLAGWSGHTLVRDIDEGAYVHGLFAAINVFATTYAFFAFIGAGSFVVDVVANLKEFVYRPVDPSPPSQQVPHWASVLYVGSSVSEEVVRSAPLAVALAAQDRFVNSGEDDGAEGADAETPAATRPTPSRARARVMGSLETNP
jgi:cellulose synthase/poly-beta-1,6-N-acetylglucosamine synthase-like glycosyltransferase